MSTQPESTIGRPAVYGERRRRPTLRRAAMTAAMLVLPFTALTGFTAVPAQASSPCTPVSCVYDYGSNSAPITCISSACGPGLEIREGNGDLITMDCWFDSSSWYTGNYASNRWFEVSAPGLPGLWLIHSSYVYNQVRVGLC
jgi:hypothetical protein